MSADAEPDTAAALAALVADALTQLQWIEMWVTDFFAQQNDPDLPPEHAKSVVEDVREALQAQARRIAKLEQKLRRVMHELQRRQPGGSPPPGDEGVLAGWILSTLTERIAELEAGSIGAKLIAVERQRQIGEEGWTAEHDDEHDDGELAQAAACYALPEENVHLRHMLNSARGLEDAGYVYDYSSPEPGQIDWPWAGKWYKRTPDNHVRELVKAGALIAAEIDRLHRASATKVR